MRIYTAVRHVPPLMGRGLRGNRLLMGPYNIKREGPVLLVGVGAAVSVALAGVAGAGIWPGLVLALLGTGIILVTTAAVLGYLRGVPTWPPTHVRLMATRNQWTRRPVHVSGRSIEPPPVVVAGGPVKVQR